MEALISDLSAPKLGKVGSWEKLEWAPQKKVSDGLIQTVVFNDVDEPGEGAELWLFYFFLLSLSLSSYFSLSSGSLTTFVFDGVSFYGFPS